MYNVWRVAANYQACAEAAREGYPLSYPLTVIQSKYADFVCAQIDLTKGNDDEDIKLEPEDI